MSLATLIVWGADKAAAMAGAWRVPERTLLALVFLGGALGGGLGMLLFRHKTRKLGFKAAILAAGALQAGILVLLLR
ncbi:MAG: DUF1294 domain-containing protein [Anaerolineaceae bacterium]|nr:DUF1294 domain-containing protein [Anaerolineaceae bacterium]